VIVLNKEQTSINFELERYLNERSDQWKKENKKIKPIKSRVKKKKPKKGSKPISHKTKADIEKSDGDVVIIEEAGPGFFQRLINSIISIFSRKEEVIVEDEEMKEDLKKEAKALDLDEKEMHGLIEDVDESEESDLKPLWQRFKESIRNFFNPKYKELKLMEKTSRINSQELESDMRKIFKTINKMVTSLPPRCLASVKKSEHFNEYKKFINKYNLIWAAKKRTEHIKGSVNNEENK